MKDEFCIGCRPPKATDCTGMDSCQGPFGRDPEQWLKRKRDACERCGRNIADVLDHEAQGEYVGVEFAEKTIWEDSLCWQRFGGGCGVPDWREELKKREAAEVALAAVREENERLTTSREFYARRCDLIQAHQHRMRDPERTLLCDVLANGQLLPDPDGKRYGGARPDDGRVERVRRYMEVHGYSDGETVEDYARAILKEADRREP